MGDQVKTNISMLVVIGLSILSVISQVYTYKFLWPTSSAMGGPMGMMAYEIQSAIALIAISGISIVVFILMLFMGIKWYVGQGIAILNFFVAVMASVG